MIVLWKNKIMLICCNHSQLLKLTLLTHRVNFYHLTTTPGCIICLLLARNCHHNLLLPIGYPLGTLTSARRPLLPLPILVHQILHLPLLKSSDALSESLLGFEVEV